MSNRLTITVEGCPDSGKAAIMMTMVDALAGAYPNVAITSPQLDQRIKNQDERPIIPPSKDTEILIIKRTMALRETIPPEPVQDMPDYMFVDENGELPLVP